MTQTKQVKDYYAILGLNHDATQDQIEQAYNRMAVEHHPKKITNTTLETQKKFKDICQAYKILSNKSKRSHYDNLLKEQFTLEQALQTFQQFYDQFGIENAEEKDFFEENHLHTMKDYYHILGVSKQSSLHQIQEAYRKLALKLHPKKNPDDQESKKKFIEVNEAYNALSEEKRRSSYNDLTFKLLNPLGAHQIFEEFFCEKPFKNPEEEQLFRPLIQTRWASKLDKLMNDENHWPAHQGSETRRIHEVYSNKNGVESRKIVKENKKVVDGKIHHEVEEEYQLPNGEKEIRKTLKQGDKVEKKVYHLKRGEDAPKEIENQES